MIEQLSSVSHFIDGKKAIPAGAIPLAQNRKGKAVICLLPSGDWITWTKSESREIRSSKEIQKEVMEVLMFQLGGTAKAVGDRLDISSRTVEGLRTSATKLSHKLAFKILTTLAYS